MIYSNYYELLGISPDSNDIDIRKAYIEKSQYLVSDSLKQDLDSAFQTLIDPVSRNKYDRSIGLHRYKKVNKGVRTGKGILRVLLTGIDAAFTWWWSFLLAIILCLIGYTLYQYYWYGVVIEYKPLIIQYKLYLYIVFGISIIIFLSHYYVRRANRYLKHLDWEVIEKGELYGKRK